MACEAHHNVVCAIFLHDNCAILQFQTRIYIGVRDSQKFYYRFKIINEKQQDINRSPVYSYTAVHIVTDSESDLILTSPPGSASH